MENYLLNHNSHSAKENGTVFLLNIFVEEDQRLSTKDLWLIFRLVDEHHVNLLNCDFTPQTLYSVLRSFHVFVN